MKKKTADRSTIRIRNQRSKWFQIWLLVLILNFQFSTIYVDMKSIAMYEYWDFYLIIRPISILKVF